MTTSGSSGSAAPRGAGFGRGIAIVVGAAFVFFGLWALAAPQAFYDSLATFPPYNQHFIQDIGSFQIGLGAVLLLAVVATADRLAVALVGVGIGATAHLYSHIIGRDLGGEPARDITTQGILAILLLVAGFLRWRD